MQNVNEPGMILPASRDRLQTSQHPNSGHDLSSSLSPPGSPFLEDFLEERRAPPSLLEHAANRNRYEQHRPTELPAEQTTRAKPSLPAGRAPEQKAINNENSSTRSKAHGNGEGSTLGLVSVQLPVEFTVQLPAATQRYFKIPFFRMVDISEMARRGQRRHSRGAKELDRGLWLAHFDGEWIARQMVLMGSGDGSAGSAGSAGSEGADVVFMVAGVDDIRMCELSLAETGLETQKGAICTESEFNKHWNRFGGSEYLLAVRDHVTSRYLQQQLRK